ncbi:MAG: T9SS type A sorting domain-containing protein [Bacteroidia bacterium]
MSFLATDLEPNVSGRIRYQTLGTAGNRRFVLNFENVPYYASSNIVSVQLILYEVNDYIEVHCTRVDADPNSAVTQGIQEDMNNGEFAPGRNNVVLQSRVTNDAIRFRPQVNNVVYSWTSDGGNGVFQDSTQADPTTNPLGLSANGFYTFYVQADNGDCILYDTVIVPISVLGVDDVYFSAKKEGNQSLLRWNSPEASDIQRFTIEHQQEGAEFVPIFQQEKTQEISYQYLHSSPAPGLNRYRLRIHQQDGSIRYSRIEELYFEGLQTATILPNPGKSDFVLHFHSAAPAKGSLQLLDAQGRVVHRESIVAESAGEQARALDLSRLSAGVYVYKLELEGSVSRGKLVLR